MGDTHDLSIYLEPTYFIDSDSPSIIEYASKRCRRIDSAKDKAIAIGSYITGRAYQFSADIVSVSGDGRSFRRCRIVVENRKSPATIIYRRDLTHLGWPLDPEILKDLRRGVSIEEVLEQTTEEVQ